MTNERSKRREPLFLIPMGEMTPEEMTDVVAQQLQAIGIEVTDDEWDTDELARDFEVLGFLPQFVVVRRRSDGVKGSLEFTPHTPRRYFNFQPEPGDEPTEPTE